jgi:hypothetical protein
MEIPDTTGRLIALFFFQKLWIIRHTPRRITLRSISLPFSNLLEDQELLVDEYGTDEQTVLLIVDPQVSMGSTAYSSLDSSAFSLWLRSFIGPGRFARPSWLLPDVDSEIAELL